MDLEKFKYTKNGPRDPPAVVAPIAPRRAPISATIPPILVSGLRLVFVGYNPGLKSGLTGHHYAHHSNRFWKLLLASGLVNEPVSAPEDGTLPERYGYGFTDLVARTTRSASELSRHEKEEGAAQLEQRLRQVLPKCICFVGKGIWEVVAKAKGYRGKFEYGLQPHLFARAHVFVVPSTSGLVSIGWDIQLELWQQLYEVVRGDESERVGERVGVPSQTLEQETNLEQEIKLEPIELPVKDEPSEFAHIKDEPQ